MAQVFERIPGRIDFKNASVAIPEALTTLLQIPVDSIEELGLAVVVAGQALDQFAVLGKFHRDDPAFSTLYSVAGDYTSPAGLVVDASGNLTLQAVGTGWLILDVRPLVELQIKVASGNPAGSTVSAYGHGSGAKGGH